MEKYTTLAGAVPALGLGLLALSFTVTPQAVNQSAMAPANAAQVEPSSPVRLAQVPNRPLRRDAAQRAKYEPARGAYLGVALDYSNLQGAGAVRDKMTAAMQGWETEAGRKHAIYLQFLQFPYEDGRFPTWDTDPKGWATAADFCQAAAGIGGTPMLTLEPMQPALYRQWQAGSPAYDATVGMAQSIGKWGKPIFIRFAHEMNGHWYPWDEWIDKNKNLRRDPGEDTGFTAADYHAAFRNVALVFRQFAPNAALVWCPNSGLLGGERRDVFRPFYPGDDVVDWVGLDVYERGWTMPMPGSKLWGGSFWLNLTHDMADDPKTPDPVNESVDFYKTFASRKPFMICETGATLSYRTDLTPDQRGPLTHSWKTGYWDDAEYGWMQAVYGTSDYRDQKLLHPLDTDFPRIKAIVWFQIAKHEDIPVAKSVNGQDQIVWFNDGYADYRIGGSATENGPRSFAPQEFALYRRLTASPYFLSAVQ